MSFVRMVEVSRGALVESVHCGVAAIANAQGEIIAGWGETGLVTFPRSALKPIQAIALVETGAAAAFRLTPQQVAFACASHYGEPFHVRTAESWLAALGLNEEALACGPDRPMDPRAADEAVRAARPERRVFHNCSGKHCGMLTVARHQGWPTEGYRELQHPVQQLYLDALSDLLLHDARGLDFGIDGCTLPAAALSVADAARVMARFAAAAVPSESRRRAIVEIHDAMLRHPEYVSGSAQANVDVLRATHGRIVVKTGAEGFMAAYWPAQGLGMALKIADGAARARVPALLAALAAAGLLQPDEQAQLAGLAQPPVLDSAGRPVGAIRTCLPSIC